jgi:hypothetical protein
VTAGQAGLPGEASQHLADDEDRYSRAALSILTDPGDEVLGALLRAVSPGEVLDLIRSDCRDPGSVLRPAGQDDRVPRDGAHAGSRTISQAAADRAIERWRARRADVPPLARLELWEQAGLRIVCPGEPEWPTQLDDLGDARPVAIWLQGTANLRFACLHSVSVVGSRAATAYGSHVATELSAELSGLGWTVISGGAKVLYPETVVAGRSLFENLMCSPFASPRQTGRSCSSPSPGSQIGRAVHLPHSRRSRYGLAAGSMRRPEPSAGG